MSKRRRLNHSVAVTVKDAPTGYGERNILSTLPYEFFAVNILVEYLTLEELAGLDTAITNHALRAYFMQVYACVVLNHHTVLKFDAAVKG
jgi:hypothetical protein